MKSSATNRGVIDTRGRLYAENPSYSICVLDKKGSAFKTLVGLADEAAIAKARLAHTVETGHPLSSTLMGMSCAEAISSLLAYTATYAGTSPQAKVSGFTEHPVVQFSIEKETRNDRAAFKTKGPVPTAVDDVLDLDDESFAAFARFPAAAG